ncbi:MAG: hypothetical protein CSA33_08950 [Desulfobulbus propionicus]|nr:MAG: hypothetical protein CSA33_08950 [Desulfobulbus propionicus]
MNKASHTIPEFAIIGHPNEGKSSVLSTLAEDDSVRVSPMPGETVACQTFPVVIDGQEIIRFIDTPGFQNPKEILQWMQAYTGEEILLIQAFIQAHKDNPDFRDDCELLAPVAAGAGVIFVADGSKPVRNVDRAEMEILRLTGAPRMAILNSKDNETGFLENWHVAFRKHFNATRLFNSAKATYVQRIELLESLKSIDQKWEPALRRVILSFTANWQARTQKTVACIVEFLEEVLAYTETLPCAKEEEEQARRKVRERFEQHVADKERRVQDAIRRLFKHNIFNVTLPRQSILQEDLFSEQTWKFLGLSDRQVIMAGAMGGAAVGAGVDLAAAGISFGLFSTLGGVLGGLGTALKGKQWLGELRLLGMHVGGDQVQVGPVNNVQLLYVLLDRFFLFYSHVINWAHGRRDYVPSEVTGSDTRGGYTTLWSREQRAVAERFFKQACSGSIAEYDAASVEFRALLEQQLNSLSESEYQS